GSRGVRRTRRDSRGDLARRQPASRFPVPGEVMTQPARPAEGAPGLLSSAGRVFDLSLGQMLWSRRSVFLGVLLGGPVLLASALRIAATLYASGLKINGVQAGGSAIFGMMIWLLYIRFIVPVLGVFYGTALIADEVDDRTITYLFTRPIPRSAVLLGKYLAYLVCTVLLILPSVVIVYLMVASIAGSLAQCRRSRRSAC